METGTMTKQESSSVKGGRRFYKIASDIEKISLQLKESC